MSAEIINLAERREARRRRDPVIDPAELIGAFCMFATIAAWEYWWREVLK